MIRVSGRSFFSPCALSRATTVRTSRSSGARPVTLAWMPAAWGSLARVCRSICRTGTTSEPALSPLVAFSATRKKVARLSRARNVVSPVLGQETRPRTYGWRSNTASRVSSTPRGPGIVERFGAFEGDREELADWTAEAGIEQVFGAGGFGLPLASSTNVEQPRGRGGLDRGDSADHCPYDKHHPTPAHQRSGESIHQLQRLLRIFGAAAVRFPVEGAGGNILDGPVPRRQRGSSGLEFPRSCFL